MSAVASLEQALNDFHLSDRPESKPTSTPKPSEDNHKGNGIACRFYNHNGCHNGKKCKFSHAPDSKSMRDHLGKNVCLYFLLGMCKFGKAKCIYSHSKDNLPEDGWWNKDDQSVEMRTALNKIGIVDKGKKGSAKHDKARAKQGNKLPQVPPCLPDMNWDFGWYSDDDESGGMLGFTASEVDELLCQGVKPWDDDAHVVLAMLSSY